MSRRATPKKGIKYKFRFKTSDKGTYVLTFLYEERNEKGREVFYCYEYKKFVTMDGRRFSWLHRFALVSETPVKIEIKEVQQIMINEPEMSETEMKAEEQKLLNKLRSLTEEQEKVAMEKLGKSPKILVEELETYFKTDKGSPALIGQAMLVLDSLNIKFAKI